MNLEEQYKASGVIFGGVFMFVVFGYLSISSDFSHDKFSLYLASALAFFGLLLVFAQIYNIKKRKSIKPVPVTVKINKFEHWLYQDRNHPAYDLIPSLLFSLLIAFAVVTFLISRSPDLEAVGNKVALFFFLLAYLLVLVTRVFKEPSVVLTTPLGLLPIYLLFESVFDKQAAYQTLSFWVISILSVSTAIAIGVRGSIIKERINKVKEVT